MLEEILRRWQESDFDVRRIACSTDPLRSHFDEWVSYYKLKSAIAATLQPATILEIGVRYGYSYAAFKHGFPQARYVGIDLDTSSFGGEVGAVEWARQLAAGTTDTFLVGDSQTMQRFPGKIYDLIHIDGQQDGGGSYHDLSVAVSQGRYLLVDGYLWTAENCHSVSEFLLRYRDVLAWSLLLPGYAGELLIKVRPESLAPDHAGGGSAAIVSHYTESYYREDCGGWEAFREHRGRRLDNPRLESLLDLALASRPRRLLDLGCGRGEITYQAARAGVQVTAVDYSPAAIQIAQSAFQGEAAAVCERVEWICGSAAELSLQGAYDTVVAGDLIEHLAPEELEQMYATVSRHLAPGGTFIIHTFPNAWFYRYDYARRRRVAASVGAFLPADPRSRYERLMHINEQSPRTLRRQLRRHFAHVRLWFLEPEMPAGSLARPMGRRELAACRDLYAVARKDAPIAVEELLAILQMLPLPAAAMPGARLAIVRCVPQAEVNGQFTVTVSLENGAEVPLVSRPPHPVHLSYHWRDPATEEVVIFDGLRTSLAPAALPGASGTYTLEVKTPARAGTFRLEVDLVQEGIGWFNLAAGCSARQKALVTVIA